MKTPTNKSKCSFERLEERQMMTFLPTDMTQVAALTPPHAGQTELYLNFDGGNISDAQGTENVAAFTAEPGHDRNQAIADIIYRVSEIYSPFNVGVHRTFGAGTYSNSNGDSTIFIGAIGTDTQVVAKQTVKVTAGFTPAASSDYPGSNKGYSHAPNSDAYDLGFVDPVAKNGSSNSTIWDDQTISQAIAHESGHTFGLAHVLTSPTPEIMSYDSTNSYFANQAFPITTLNYNASTGVTAPSTGLQPVTMGNITFPGVGNIIRGTSTPVPSMIKTQNSYTFLQAALGSRDPATDYYPWHIADTTTAEPSYAKLHSAGYPLKEAGHISAVLSQGVGDVFTVSNPTSQTENEIVKLSAGARANPEILVYDASGTHLLKEVHGKSQAIQIPAESNVLVVVSGYDGNGSGVFNIAINRAALQNGANAQVTIPILSGTTILNNPFGTQKILENAASNGLKELLG